MAFQSQDFILDNPVPSGVSPASKHSRIPRLSNQLNKPPSSSPSLRLRPRFQETRKRFCSRYGDAGGSMNYADDSESLWTSRTSSQLTSPEPLSAREELRPDSVNAFDTTSLSRPSTQHYDNDLDMHNGENPFDSAVNHGVPPTAVNPADVFAPASEGKRKRTLSQTEDADESSQGQETPQGQHHTGFSLTSMVNTLLGGIPGKVWSFCWGSSFHGFHAGGGEGYDISAPENTPPHQPAWKQDESANADKNMEDVAFEEMAKPPSLPFAGERPSMDHSISGDSGYESQFAFPSSCGTKESASPWILVQREPAFEERQVEHRRVPTATSILSAPSTYNTSPSNSGTVMPPPRKHPRRNTIVHPITPRPRRVLLGGSGRKRQTLSTSRIPFPASRSSYSINSPLGKENTRWQLDDSPGSSTNGKPPASLEAQRLAAQVRRKEREEDASIRRLNQQLKAMIKEGREALGTKVEVDEEDDADGWD